VVKAPFILGVCASAILVFSQSISYFCLSQSTIINKLKQLTVWLANFSQSLAALLTIGLIVSNQPLTPNHVPVRLHIQAKTTTGINHKTVSNERSRLTLQI